MSASLETNNYKLPVYTNEDTIAYIPDWNKAMREIDAQMNVNANLGTGNAADVQNLLDLHTAISSEVQTLTTQTNLLYWRRIPSYTKAPGIDDLFLYGCLTGQCALIDGDIWVAEGALERGLIHFDVGDLRRVQICTFAGNPFNVHATISNMAVVGNVIVRAQNNSIYIERLYVSFENNITYFHINVNKDIVNIGFGALLYTCFLFF